MAKFVTPGIAPTVDECAGKLVVFHLDNGAFSQASKVLPVSKKAKEKVPVNYCGVGIQVALTQIVMILDDETQVEMATKLHAQLGDVINARTASINEAASAKIAERDAEIARVTAEFDAEIDEINAKAKEVEAEVLAEFASKLPQPAPVVEAQTA